MEREHRYDDESAMDGHVITVQYEESLQKARVLVLTALHRMGRMATMEEIIQKTRLPKELVQWCLRILRKDGKIDYSFVGDRFGLTAGGQEVVSKVLLDNSKVP